MYFLKSSMMRRSKQKYANVVLRKKDRGLLRGEL